MIILGFGIFPPEINSRLMYTGPGSASLFTAAASWDNLAEELHYASAQYRMIVSDLLSGPWQGPSAMRMVQALMPYTVWMSTTATKAEETANHIRLAANAYEVAHSATVPPEVVTANRMELAILVATNFFGQNTPAIAANWAAYCAMWSQDAIAMDTYAQVASCARALSPFDSPPQVAQPLVEEQELASSAANIAHAGVITHIAAAHGLAGTSSSMHSLASASAAKLTGSPSIFKGFFGKTMTTAQMYNTGIIVPWTATMIMAFVTRFITSAISTAINIVTGGGVVNTVANLGSWWAHLGDAGIIGGLSVPPSWTELTAAEGTIVTEDELNEGMQEVKATLVHSLASPSSSLAEDLLQGVPMVARNVSKDKAQHKAVMVRRCLRPNVVPYFPAVG